jgi:hypothetical protein
VQRTIQVNLPVVAERPALPPHVAPSSRTERGRLVKRTARRSHYYDVVAVALRQLGTRGLCLGGHHAGCGN